MARVTGHKRILHKVVSVMMALLFVLGAMPPIALDVAAADRTFTSADGAVYLDSSYSGKEIIIQNGVFSVTVNGATNITIIFDNVIINRRTITDETGTYTDAANGQTIANLYEVSQKLNAQGKAQVCPFLITGNAEVTAQFRGTCKFYAGTNSSTVDSSNKYTASQDGCGYAGIQVQSGSTLIIDDAMDLTVFGGVQHAIPDENGNVTVGKVTAKYSDTLRANASISAASYTDPFTKGEYKGPNGRDFDSQSGGAGIGGGAWLNTESSASQSYTNGTPGTIIINKGNIEAWGGVQAAGIGGGVNSAATTGLIQINGGNITAHGGRFGAGIGDGDSVNGNTSTTYRDAHSTIEINGGNITVYGGVASPGIGSSDEVSHANGGNGFGEDTLRDMEISINGGNINAFSGFPKVFNGSSYPDDAPAAIGAGSFTSLPANSIYISSASTQLDASFSNYAITENGSDGEAAPTINVDSDGYLFLLRMGDYNSTSARELVLYLPLTIEHRDTGVICTIYKDQSTDKLFYVDDDGNAYDESWTLVEPEDKALDHVTLHVDPKKSQRIKSIELAYYFRSVAITLPHPSLYGGMYALTVPVNGVSSSEEKPKTDSFISITVDAREQGTQSGVVKYPSLHNLELSKKAGAFTDLDVFDQNSTIGLIGNSYMPNVYAYTVYIDAASTEATLYAKWTNNNSKIYLDNKEQTISGTGSEREATFTIDMSGVTQKTVRLKKIDNNYSLGAVSYKITIIKKGEYKLTFDDPSKIYDGKPVTVTPLGVYMPNMFDVRHVPDEPVDTTPKQTLPKDTDYGWNEGSMYLASSGYGYYNVTYYVINVSTRAEVYVVSSSSSETVINYVLHIRVSSNQGDTKLSGSDYAMGFQVRYATGSNGTVTVTRSILQSDPKTNPDREWVTGSTQISGTIVNNGEIYLVITSSNNNNGSNTIDIRYGNNASSTDRREVLLELGSSTTSKTTVTESGTAESKAWEALSLNIANAVFPYEDYTFDGTVQNFITYIPTVTTRNNGYYGTQYSAGTHEELDKTYNVTGVKTVTASGKYEVYPTGWELATLPAADLDHIQYTFTRIKDADGNAVTEAPTTDKPVNAGTYRVDALLEMTSYNASGTFDFTIDKREVYAVQIENWLLYMSSHELIHYDGFISDPGDIIISNIVEGEDVSMTADAAANEFFYNDTSVGYSADKITIKNPVLQGPAEVIINYCIAYTDEANREVRVFGQIAYDMTGAMFKKTLNGVWRKYLNVSNDILVDNSNADYQSPKETDTTNGAYLSHAQYILTRTENEGSDSGRYAIDIEYGELQYSFHHSRWNVNTLEYEENVNSYWDGNNGTNNKVTIINYSNYQIQYQISADIFFLYAPATQGSHAGISAMVTTDATDVQGNAQISQDAWISMAAAIPGDYSKQGTAAQRSYYIYISGVPQMSDADGLHIGNVTLKFKPIT